MKSKIILLVLLISLLLVSTFSNAQQKKIDLTILVDTDNIEQTNIPETCFFEDQPENTSIIDYLTEVQPNDEVKWKVKKADGSRAAVRLVKFKHEKGIKVFNQNEILEKNGRIKGIVASDSIGETEKYIIEITVKREGDWENFYIDPKLKLISQTR